MSKVEKTAGIIKLGVALGSAYMLYKQYQKGQAAEALAQAMAAQLAQSGASASATMPLVAAMPQAVSLNLPTIVPAASVSTDQQDVVQKLIASGAQKVFGMGSLGKAFSAREPVRFVRVPPSPAQAIKEAAPKNWLAQIKAMFASRPAPQVTLRPALPSKRFV
jgi:hypothetical protein